MDQAAQLRVPKAIRLLKVLLAGRDVQLHGQRIRLLDGEPVAVVQRCEYQNSQLVPVQEVYVPYDMTLSAFIKAADTVSDEDLYISEADLFIANAEKTLSQINLEGGCSRLHHSQR